MQCDGLLNELGLSSQRVSKCAIRSDTNTGQIRLPRFKIHRLCRKLGKLGKDERDHDCRDSRVVRSVVSSVL